jgi:hypothetical protein
MRYHLTTPDLSLPYRQRQRAERVARERLMQQARRRQRLTRKTDPLPKGWEPPF